MGAGFCTGGLVNNGCFALLRVWILCGCIGIGIGGNWSAARGPAVAAQTASLPMVLADEWGVRWDIQHDGSVSDGGNDLYDGGGHLFLDNNMQWTSGRI